MAPTPAQHNSDASEKSPAGRERPGSSGAPCLHIIWAFLIGIDEQCMIDMLVPRISAANAEGAALRAVMLKYGSITPELTQVLGQAIITGVIESESSDYHAATIGFENSPTGIGRYSRRHCSSLGFDRIGCCAGSARCAANN